MHPEPHPLAGKSVKLRLRSADTSDLSSGDTYRIEDYWDRVSGGLSWMDAVGNPACILYAIRSGHTLPLNNEVVYGKVRGLGHLVHVFELGEIEDEMAEAVPA